MFSYGLMDGDVIESWTPIRWIKEHSLYGMIEEGMMENMKTI